MSEERPTMKERCLQLSCVRLSAKTDQCPMIDINPIKPSLKFRTREKEKRGESIYILKGRRNSS
jgi:hypothetical protein